MLLFGVICVVCVWRRLCGLVLCIQTTGRLNTKHPAANVGRESGVWRPTYRNTRLLSVFWFDMYGPAKTKNERTISA